MDDDDGTKYVTHSDHDMKFYLKMRKFFLPPSSGGVFQINFQSTLHLLIFH